MEAGSWGGATSSWKVMNKVSMLGLDVERVFNQNTSCVRVCLWSRSRPFSPKMSATRHQRIQNKVPGLGL